MERGNENEKNKVDLFMLFDGNIIFFVRKSRSKSRG